MKTRYLAGLAIACVCWLTVAPATAAPDDADERILERIVIDQVWSAVRVRFSLLTHEPFQYVAYYNSDRRMTVGMRRLDEDTFTLKVLPSRSGKPPTRDTSSTVQGWDSHNSIIMSLDKTGHIHLAGNMHANPLTYFRSEKPWDISTLVQVDAMVGRNEERCTYPRFRTTPDGELIFHYRDGGSGNGVEIYNSYDTETRKWSRFLDTPLISGQGKMNAYQDGPNLGPDGRYHLLWMWRDTPDAATNHDISYARSKDLRNWENVHGQPLTLPITIESTGTIIDPVPAGGGMINSNMFMSFDRNGKPLISYHKHDENGHTQAYVARFQDGDWKVKAVSDWKATHIFRGRGSGPATFGTSLSTGPVEKFGDEHLAVPFDHWIAGKGLIVMDHDTLEAIKVVDRNPAVPNIPESLAKAISEFPGMSVRLMGDRGQSPDPGTGYLLRWESLGSNRDRPREGNLPEDSDLVLYKIKR